MTKDNDKPKTRPRMLNNAEERLRMVALQSATQHIAARPSPLYTHHESDVVHAAERFLKFLKG